LSGVIGAKNMIKEMGKVENEKEKRSKMKDKKKL
jgi:hypothetical protein